jgi:hypothetical protein
VGWGVYVNYVFYAVWLVDAAWWRWAPDHAGRPPAVVWALRGFYFVIVLNAAVIFALGPRRALGVLMVGWLAVVWAISSRRAPAPAR